MSAGGERYLVAGRHPWNRRVFDERIARLPGRWEWAGAPDELTAERLEALDPRMVFFLHWSWIVPEAITARWECVVFHMTDLPYGRGGSPLQNLILRGHRETVLSAVRMTSVLDGGPVYARRRLSLEGSAQQIYERAAELAASMIASILRERPQPQPQVGEPTVFRRRTPADSRIPALPDASALHDFLRMLDADGYPRAFLDHEGFRYTFRDARLDGERVYARVEITPLPGGGQETP